MFSQLFYIYAVLFHWIMNISGGCLFFLPTFQNVLTFLTCRVTALPLALVTDQIGRALGHARQTEAIVTDVARPAAVFLSNEEADPVLYVRRGRRTGRLSKYRKMK